MVLSVRAALRVMTLVATDGRTSAETHGRDWEADVILPVFRANALAWAAVRYPAQARERATTVAASAAHTAAGVAAAIRARVANAAAEAAGWAAEAADQAVGHAAATNADAARARGGAYAAADSAARAARADAAAIWEAVGLDADQLLRGRAPAELALSPLREGKNIRFFAEQLRMQSLMFGVLGDDWMIWQRWCESRFDGLWSFGLQLEKAEQIDLRLALQNDEWWRRKPAEINADIAAWVEEARRELDAQSAIDTALKEIDGEVTLDSIESPPPEPASGPGPQYTTRSGKLSLSDSFPDVSEVEPQHKLHTRLRDTVAQLEGAIAPASNQYPSLASSIREYRDLIDQQTEELEVIDVWSVGGAIAALARAYQDQNKARTLENPLEPNIEGLLQSVVRQHGAFIMGFAEGRDLVGRADEFIVDAQVLSEVEEPGNELLGQFTENVDLVDERSRAVHQPVRDVVVEIGWGTSRAGYSAYLTVRNAVHAMIRLTVGRDANFGTIVGVIAGTSVLAGDPNVEFIRAAIPVLQTYGNQMLAFFNHSPEFRAYVQWALDVLEQDHDEGKSG